MRDSELRGVILEALYNQRRKDLVNLDQELGGLPVPDSATESILRHLVKKGLVERPIQPLNGLGNARITAYGIDVVQGTTSPPLSILLHQRITVQDVQVGLSFLSNRIKPRWRSYGSFGRFPPLKRPKRFEPLVRELCQPYLSGGTVGAPLFRFHPSPNFT
jgi:hypothetical protein